ncbi:MAG: CDP-diacylglycerol--serine O-phosphatidyltransferase [Polyangia bacterium]
MRAKHLIPNAVTLANIAFGFLGIVAAAEGRFERSVVLLFCAALCDLCDGKLARLLKASSKFGMELDSLSDVVSFGIAPAVLIYLAVLERLGALGAAIAVVYALCGALRLARYNTDSGPLSEVTFLGAPIPIAAGYIMSFVMVRNALPVWLVAGGTLWVAGCMVSTLKVPKFRSGSGLPSLMLLVGMVTFVVFLARPSAITWHLWNGWNVVLIVANYVYLGRRGHLESRREARALKRAA